MVIWRIQYAGPAKSLLHLFCSGGRSNKRIPAIGFWNGHSFHHLQFQILNSYEKNTSPIVNHYFAGYLPGRLQEGVQSAGDQDGNEFPGDRWQHYLRK